MNMNRDYWFEERYADALHAQRKLTTGKLAIWKADVKMAFSRPWGMFTKISSKRHCNG